MIPAQVTVWFDGACPLCLREIRLMRRLDRRGAIDFVDIGADGAAAFAAMWRAIPALRPLGQAARFPPLLWLLERAYRGFLRIRPRLQVWAGARG
jgi:predicted DCC family thiol-disulfide oxidoreductase YuxK